MVTPIQTQIRLPGKYHKQPVISRLTSRYGLTVNITAASLMLGASNEGWFNIELSGNPEKLTNSLSYLKILGIDILQLEITNQLKPSQISKTISKLNSHEIISDDAIINYQRHYQLHEYLSKSEHQLQIEADNTKNNNTARLKLQLGILKRYQHKPIISELVSNFGLTVNITGALLNDGTYHDGLFELEIWGQVRQIHSSLMHLEKLGLSVLINASPESDTETLIF
ncbi:hypothetical protein NIES4071_97900 [Calothrix sp. NIES-4071]|nr:hypothetical protein NIES4071_97900 [Calothrix sp. NIES-4071]BAZ64054.1 hypothetical protein NIES4105_97830 [Calothrix sp. NIES-4105]